MLKRSLSLLSRQGCVLSQDVKLMHQPKYFLNHIKNMLDEQKKYQVEKLHEQPLVVETDSNIKILKRNFSKQLIINSDFSKFLQLLKYLIGVYKPSHTIEFNREGEVLLYSCEPSQHMTVYLKYPYILYESAIPACLFMYLNNPLELSWYFNNAFVAAMCTLWIPRVWYFRGFNYRPRKIYLLRGGKYIKVEHQSLAGDRFVSWVENYMIHPLTEDMKEFDDRDNAEFLQDEGQLKYELAVQLDHFTEMGVTQQDQVLYFLKEGKIHEPEIFEAVMKGYNVDTSDFVINTANNLRVREGNHSH